MKKNYRDFARDLKRLGLINYDLRQSLSSGQKSQITKLAREWGHYLKHPENFHAARVGKATAKELKTAGFKVTPKGRAVIPLGEFKAASIKKSKIVFDNGRGLRETTYLVDHKKFLPQLKSLSDRPLPRNKMVTVRIGDHAAFKRARFNSYAELYHYLQEDFEPNDPGEDGETPRQKKKRVIALMSIVEVNAPTTKEGYKIDPDTGEILMPRHAKKKALAKKKRRN